MKSSSQNLYNIVKDESFITQLNQLSQKIPSYQVGELTIPQAVDEINKVRKLIIEAGDTGVLDEVNFNKKNSIITSLNTIKNSIANIAQLAYNISNQNTINALNNIITHVHSMVDVTESSLIYRKLIDKIDLKSQIDGLISLKKEYELKLKEVESISEIKIKAESTFSSIQEFKLRANEISENIGKQLELGESNIVNLTGIVDDANAFAKGLKKTEEEIESKRLKITTFHTNIEELEKRNKDNEKTLDDYIYNTRLDTSDIINDFSKETKTIKDENITLQLKIKELLQGANAGELFKAFELRKTQVETGLYGWLTGIIIVTLSIVGLAVWLAEAFKGSTLAMDGFIIIKIISAIPLLILDVFLVNQYNNKRNLAEEYAFRAAISLSFLSYKELIEEMKDKPDSMKFVIDTVQRIYEYPFDKQKLSKSQIKTVESLMGKSMDFTNTILKGGAVK